MLTRTSFTFSSFLFYPYLLYKFLIILILATGAWVLPAIANDTQAPQWWQNPPQDVAYYYGVGRADVEGEEWDAWEEARNQGLLDIAEQVKTRILAMQADYNRQAGNKASNFFVSISTQITQVVEYDTKPVKRERRLNTCYVLLRAPKDKARAIISDLIDQEVQKNPLFQKETAQTIAEIGVKPTPISISTLSPTGNYAKRNSLGINLALEWSDDELGMGVELLEFHWSFLSFTSVGIGWYPYFVGGYDTWEFETIALGASLYAGLVYPLATNHDGFNAWLYTDFLFTMQGVFDKGFMTGAGFDAGIALTWDGPGLDIRYRGVVYENHYANSLGIGFVQLFND
ncbi:MAG: LPP20 family lipoprotein [Treponema sp.]|jgi:hypothetical protein|nr:LPP20 family lipoprotein [Treponema sp.]